MKDSLERLADAERRAAAASAAIATALDARERYLGALSAAENVADDARRRANDALALERVGGGSDAASAQALADAERADDRVRVVAETLAQLDAEIERQSAARDEARADQLRAARDALDAHAADVAAAFRTATVAYVAALRRVRAVEALARAAGRPLMLLAEPADALVLPALREVAADDPPRVGPLRVLWYSAGADRETGELARATQAEIARLRVLGLDLDVGVA